MRALSARMLTATVLADACVLARPACFGYYAVLREHTVLWVREMYSFEAPSETHSDAAAAARRLDGRGKLLRISSAYVIRSSAQEQASEPGCVHPAACAWCVVTQRTVTLDALALVPVLSLGAVRVSRVYAGGSTPPCA